MRKVFRSNIENLINEIQIDNKGDLFLNKTVYVFKKKPILIKEENKKKNSHIRIVNENEDLKTATPLLGEVKINNEEHQESKNHDSFCNENNNNSEKNQDEKYDFQESPNIKNSYNIQDSPQILESPIKETENLNE